MLSRGERRDSLHPTPTLLCEGSAPQSPLVPHWGNPGGALGWRPHPGLRRGGCLTRLLPRDSPVERTVTTIERDSAQGPLLPGGLSLVPGKVSPRPVGPLTTVTGPLSPRLFLPLPWRLPRTVPGHGAVNVPAQGCVPSSMQGV